MAGSHFERMEHLLVSWMVDAVLADTLVCARETDPDKKAFAPSPVVLHGFPGISPQSLATGGDSAKHVGLFAFSATHPLPMAARPWIDAGADCWIAEDIGVLPDTNRTDWLDGPERERLRSLEAGQVWVRSGENRKAVTVLARAPEAVDFLAKGYRLLAQKQLRLTPVKQFSTAFASHDAPVPQNVDLYRKPCMKETLYAGWFRVKGHNKQSHGQDRITIAQFGATVDAELERLAAELSEGRYRSRSLRTARIPKPDGDFRILKIACVRDRVVQAACLHLIEPLFDARFSSFSFAYRPGRGAHHAVAVARAAIGSGKQWAVTADTPLIGVPSAIAQPVQSMRSNARQQQVLRRNDPEILKAGLAMLGAKVGNQASLLKYFARYRKRSDHAVDVELTRSADEIRDIAGTLDGLDPVALAARNSWMGHEGRAAAKYWSSLAQLIPGKYGFPGRHTRHATDPVNSAVWRAVIRAGLDPYFGVVHGTERDQGSLVFDLIEEYRAPFGDRVLLGMLGRGFELELDKDGRLRAACRHKLVNAFHKLWHREVRWHGKIRTPADILELQVTSLKNCFLGNGEYRPFRFRW